MPTMTIGVVACGAIATHVAQIAERRNWPVTVYPLPPLLHNHPEKIAGEVDQLLTELTGKFDALAVAYADCGTYGALDEVIAKHHVPRLAGNHCYDIFAGQQEIERLMEEEPGTYFLTDFLVWLATSPTDELHQSASIAAAAIKLDLEIRQVGDTGLERAMAAILRFE
jgi:hypothetical protein